MKKCQIGENDSYLCQLIRNDLIDEFIIYVTQNNLSLFRKIEPSIFETNLFLIKNGATLIEYAAFYGSIQIFQYLRFNEVELKPNLWLYSIHSKSGELIHLLEENRVDPPEQSYNYCLEESIKCHHNDIATYIKDNLVVENSSNIMIEYGFRYRNFYFGVDVDTFNNLISDDLIILHS